MALRHRRAARAADEIRGGLDRLLELALMLRPRLKIVLQRRTTLRDEEPHIDHASAVWNGYSLRRRQVEQHPPPFRVRQQCAARAPLRRAKPRPGPLLTSGTRSAGRPVRLYDGLRDASPVTHFVAMLAHPLADGGGVLALRASGLICHRPSAAVSARGRQGRRPCEPRR